MKADNDHTRQIIRVGVFYPSGSNESFPRPLF
jgi:hypothetical protein